jgi:hypothetical protein
MKNVWWRPGSRRRKWEQEYDITAVLIDETRAQTKNKGLHKQTYNLGFALFPHPSLKKVCGADFQVGHGRLLLGARTSAALGVMMSGRQVKLAPTVSRRRRGPDV